MNLEQSFLNTIDQNKEIEISIVKGVEGNAIYINHYRVAGSKPWGGGQSVFSWKCKIKEIIDALR